MFLNEKKRVKIFCRSSLNVELNRQSRTSGFTRPWHLKRAVWWRMPRKVSLFEIWWRHVFFHDHFFISLLKKPESSQKTAFTFDLWKMSSPLLINVNNVNGRGCTLLSIRKGCLGGRGALPTIEKGYPISIISYILSWKSAQLRLPLYTLSSGSIFYSLFSLHFHWYWQGEFVYQSKLLKLVIISFILVILINDLAILL